MFATRLAVVNLLLAAFNMIPAFPMDGGRVARALLSGWLGRLCATEIAVAVGRTLAIAFGIFSLVQTNNIMHVALAVFVYVMAGLELRQVRGETWEDRLKTSRSEGIWTAPPGYHWVSRGGGVWQLVPIVIPVTNAYRRASWE